MYKKLITLLALTAVLAILLTGCTITGTGGTNAVQGQGDMVTREIDVASFSGVNISGNFQVVYRQSPQWALTAVMQENLFDYLQADASPGILNVSTTRNMQTTNANRPRLYVYAPYLTSAILSGAVDALGWDKIEGENFEISISGAADMNLVLDVERLTVDASGAVNLDLELTAQRAYFNLSGAADVNLELTAGYLDVIASGACEVNINGAADTFDIRGSGAINLDARNLSFNSGRLGLSGASNAYGKCGCKRIIPIRGA